MTTQQTAYLRYQQMRQSAMRAFVAQAAGSAKNEPPTPPPSVKRHVVLTAIEEHNVVPLDVPGITVTEHDPDTWVQIPDRQSVGTGSVSYDAESSSRIRCAAPAWFQDGAVTYGLVFFSVNGERREPQRIIGSDIQWVDVVPGSDTLEVKAQYNSYM